MRDSPRQVLAEMEREIARSDPELAALSAMFLAGSRTGGQTVSAWRDKRFVLALVVVVVVVVAAALAAIFAAPVGTPRFPGNASSAGCARSPAYRVLPRDCDTSVSSASVTITLRLARRAPLAIRADADAAQLGAHEV